MKIASYNIWNSSTKAQRLNQIAEEINRINADIIGLQEVSDRNYHDQLLKLCEYQYAVFFSHDGEEEGLSVFSKHPIIESKYLECSIIALVKYNDVVINITNLHLDWKSALMREREIIALNNATRKSDFDYAFMLGDFNCSVNSSVHQDLLGQSSLLGEEANPYWYDLAESYADKTQTYPEITLDVKNNPKWNGVNTIEIDQRFDRILLQNTYPKTYPVLKNFAVFGKEISEPNGMAPSDHYGICVELNFN